MFAASKTAAAAAGTPPASTDPQFNYVTMLLHGDGTNGAQNNTFVDSSTNNFTITRNGTPTQGSFSPYGDLWSNQFPGSTSHHLTVANTTALDLTGDFTIESWVYCTSTANVLNSIVGKWSTVYAWVLAVNPSTGTLEFYYGNSGTYAGGAVLGTSFRPNTWMHVAISRSGSTVKGFVNGVQVGTDQTVTSNLSATSITYIGRDDATTRPFNGYISNVRIVKGTALYTSNFTPSTTPLTAVSGTSLLTCQSNRFRDNSSNNFAITVTGTPSVQRFSPFDPAAEYSTSVIGGSGLFTGASGNYLSVPSSAAFQFGSGDFTIEFWVNFGALPTASNYQNIYEGRRGTPGTASVGVGIYNNAGTYQLELIILSAVMSGNVSLTTNQWYHVAAVRSGTTKTLYFNGVVVATGTDSQNISSTNGPFIGTWNGSVSMLNGYLSNLRVVKGSAVYTANFTPPTAPLTAITNTSLLLNCVNAGIVDNAMMNDLVTVGNAQVSTSVKKYGTGSVYFTSSATDFLTAPSSVDTNLGSGNFTFECWFYKTASPANATNLIWWNGNSNSSSQAGLRVQLENNGTLTLLCSQSGTAWQINSTSTATYSDNVWNHLAAVRNGQTVTLYLNGVSVASGSLSATTASLFAGTVNYINNMLFGSGTWKMVGYIDDLRITKGVARYTANFTPPTAPFPNN